MARPKEFDPEIAIERAIEYFWQNGYEAATVRDLSKYMKISSSSFYNTFKDKHSLYLLALKQYVNQEFERTRPLFEQDAAPIVVLTRMFDIIIDSLLKDEKRRGSFTANATIDMAPRDPMVKDIITSIRREYREMFMHLFAQWQANKEISCAHSPHVLTDFLLNSVNAIYMLARLDPNRQMMENVATAVLSVFAPE